MSLQDDIFDIEAALKNKLELQAFKEIMKQFNKMEQDIEDYKEALEKWDNTVSVLAIKLTKSLNKD